MTTTAIGPALVRLAEALAATSKRSKRIEHELTK